MGQMTTGVILGVRAGEAPESMEDGWYSLLERFKNGDGPRPTTPSGDTNEPDLVGFWVAVGASGEDDCPSLDDAFALDGFLDVPAYRKAHRRAATAWKKFAKWATKEGFSFAEEAPRLWLVQTEVA